MITTEEALLLTLQIKDKIGDHQAIQFSLQIEKEETAVKKANYNFRRANFEAMRADIDVERLEHLIVNNDAAQGFELLKNKILEYPEWPNILYPERPHRQGGCLACFGCTFDSR